MEEGAAAAGRGGRRSRGRGMRAVTQYYRDRKWVTTKMKTEDEVREEAGEEWDENAPPVPESAAAVFGNYVIVRNIFGNSDWRVLSRVRGVCGLWRRTAAALQGMEPAQAFALHDVTGTLQFRSDPSGRVPPSLALAFANKKSFVENFPCEALARFGSACDCGKDHKMADFIDVRICHPADALVVVNCDIPSPLPQLANPRDPPNVCEEPCISGICFPQIPGVNVHKIKQLRNEDVIDRLKQITEHEKIECILVFQPNKTDVETVIRSHIDHVIDSQHDHPFALGGCRVYGTKRDDFNSCSNQGDKTVMYIIFSINKKGAHRVDFDAYSNLIVEGEDDSKQSIRDKIKQMAELASRREHSAAIKFTCIERLIEGKLENDMIKKYLPNVPLMDAFGLGEIARNHVPQNEIRRNRTKRRKRSDDIDIFYTFSTVLVVFSWGKQKDRKK